MMSAHNANASTCLTSTVLKETLLNLFKSYQPIAPVIAHRNLRMRGQAFISFPDRETAHKAKKEVAGFPLYGRPLVRSACCQRYEVLRC
jgi:RNA recognition motif-containing protein